MAVPEIMECFYKKVNENSIPIVIVFKSDYKAWKSKQSDFVQKWLTSIAFKPRSYKHIVIPATKGGIECVLVIADEDNVIWTLGNCAKELPTGQYHIATELNNADYKACLLGWGLGSYQFINYKRKKRIQSCTLNVDKIEDINNIQALLNAINLTRDMINTPAADMMPEQISAKCKSITREFNIGIEDITGDQLLKNNFPVIHAVGRASHHPPRLIEFVWGDKNNPRVSLVGKGVSFDSGGLNIKPPLSMRLMKKDMGGAAHVLGLAYAIMSLYLPVQIHVLIPAVENAISGDAYRPGDVIKARNGKTIEIDNTDAEGRLILSDALVKACEENPDIIIDFATLTGAARVALGTEIPAFFCNDQVTANELKSAAEKVKDPIWQLPLHKPYRYQLNSDIANFTNCATNGFGGAITAALFLSEFVPETTRWIHFDVMAWNIRARPGRPKGGEAMGLRAILEYLQQKYS